MLFVFKLRGVYAAPAAGQFILVKILPGQPGALFQHHYRVPCFGQRECDRATAGAAADNTYIVICFHGDQALRR